MASGWDLQIYLEVLYMNPPVRINLPRDAEVTHQIQKALVISSALLTTLFHPAFFEKKESDELRQKFERGLPQV